MARMPCDNCNRPGCRLCWLGANDGRYQRLWGLPVTAPEYGARGERAAARVPLPCVFFDDRPAEPPGQRTGRDGKVCNCQAQWLYGCELHKACVTTRKFARDGVACCEGCQDYASTIEEWTGKD
jgi:hypothetical protein